MSEPKEVEPGVGLEDIEALYLRYGESVLHRCRRLLRDETRAWDAMHRTFVRAIQKRSSFRGESDPMGWLYRIATRICLDELRQRKWVGRMPALEPDDGGSFEQRVTEHRAVANILARFSRGVQEIVVMRYFDELEIREISSRTGLSERTVARRLRDFLERAKRLLAEAPP